MSPRLFSIVLILLLLSSVGCFEATPLPRDALVKEEGVYLHPATREPYSGSVFTTFANTPLKVEQRANLRDGHYDGAVEWYFGNRQVSVREVYRGGLRDGPYQWYFESGHLYETGTYRHGRLDGPYEAYYETDDLHETGTYRAGEFDGPRKWFLGDRLVELVTYDRGRIYGPYERYTPAGTLDLKGRLQDGQPCGTWFEDGATVTYARCSLES